MKQAVYLKREKEKIRQIAREYGEQGYEVYADLPGYELPYSISGFTPDIIARTGGKVIIIEIKSSHSLEAKKNAIKQFAYYAKEHPDTRFDLIVTNPKLICPICAKAFGSYLNLARHMVLIDRPNGAHIQWLSELLGQGFTDFGFASDQRIGIALESRANLDIDLELQDIQKIATALGRNAKKHTVRPKLMYSCPVCHRTTINAMNLARHMMGMADEAHIEWIESRGVSFLGTLGLRAGSMARGSYKELAQVLDRLQQGSTRQNENDS